MSEHRYIVVSKRLVTINSASSVVARVLNVTVLLWMFQYLLKRVPADEFAVYPVVSAIIVFAPLFFLFFSGGISRYVIDAYAKGDFQEVSRIVSSIVPLLGLAMAAFLGVGLALSLNIDKIFNIAPGMVEDARLMMALLVVCFAIQTSLLPIATAGFHIKQRYVEFNLLGVLRDLARIALLVILLLYVGPSVLWVVVATVVAELVYLVLVVLRARRLVPELRFKRELVDMAKAKTLMSFGLWTSVGRLGAMIYTNAATIVLNLYGSAVDVTSFYIGATVYRQLQGVISVASVPLQPALTAMNALEDRQRLANTLLRGGRYALWVSLIVATPLAVYADTFVALYLGEEYSSAAMVIVLFMVIFPFTQPTALLPMTAMATAQVRAFFLPAFLFQLLGLGLMLFFAGEWDMGAVGVTLALTLITVGSQLFYFWWLQLRLGGIALRDYWRKTLVPGITPAAAGMLVWITLDHAVVPRDWNSLFLCVGLGALAYAISVTLTLPKVNQSIWERIANLRGAV